MRIPIDPISVVPTPWRNGAGSTRELQHRVDTQGRTLWRISIAELERHSAFSRYPGIDRTFIAFGAMRLTVDGVDHVLQAGDQLRFDGEADVTALIDTPTRALNVMTVAGRYESTVVLLDADYAAVQIREIS
jgi:uncharacterized protein